MTIAELQTVLSALQTPDNGVHHCRSCHAGTSNGWKHSEHCRLDYLATQVLEARSIVKLALEAYEKGDEYENV